jgi:hypothetical protein
MKLIIFNQQAFPLRSFFRVEHDGLSVRIYFIDGQSHYQVFPHEAQAKKVFENLIKSLEATKE